MFVHAFRLQGFSRVDRIYNRIPKLRPIERISHVPVEYSQAKINIRQADMGSTRYDGDDKQPWQLFIAPGEKREHEILNYLLRHSMSGLPGRSVANYFVFVPTKETSLFYIGGIFSTLKPTKEFGDSALIAPFYHKGGKRELRFGPIEDSEDLWGLGA